MFYNLNNYYFKMTTRVIMLLDESGSMSGKETQTISARDEILNEQKNIKLEGEETAPKFSYYKFSSTLSLPVEFDSIKDIDFSQLSYSPSGSTSLLDAIGDIMKKHENESNVILFINTDGAENTSRKYTSETIKKNLINYQDNKGWIVHYLGANVDAWNVSNQLGIREFEQSNLSIPLHRGNMRQTSQNLTNYRMQHIQRLQSAPPSINENDREMPQHLLFMNQPNPFQNNQPQPENDYFSNLTPSVLQRASSSNLNTNLTEPQ